MNSATVIKQLIQDGWVLVRERGSHHVFKKEGIPHLITISHPKKDMTIGQLREVQRISGLTLK